MSGRILTLSGGVGGAKLVLGLSKVVHGDDLIVACNTGDDFDHLGLRICPDIDSVVYALSGLSDHVRGWGRKDESWTFMSAIRDFAGPDWFNLGDGDLATHVLRTNLLQNGGNLSDVTANLASRLGIGARILPMSDDQVATIVQTDIGDLTFQHYFVREQCSPEVTGFVFDNIANATPQAQLTEALAAGVEAIVVAPSNPYVSIDPILSMPGFRSALKDAGAPIVAVSPIVGGQAIKGPTAKMMTELGKDVSVLTVTRHYHGLVDGLVIDEADVDLAAEVQAHGIKTLVTRTVMSDVESKVELARQTLEFAGVCAQ